MRIGRRTIVVAALALLSTLANCSDSTRGDGDGVSQLDPRLRGILVSGPLSSKSHTSATSAVTAMSAAGATADSQLAYVSLPSGSVVGGDSALIDAASRTSAVTQAPMIDGGFDPVAVYASADDSLDVVLFADRGRVAGRVRVPAIRQPSVIRTTPARGRTDVPLSQIITIVFSQPIAESSVTGSSVKLANAIGVVVATTISFDAGRPWVVTLAPVDPLAPNSIYRILVDATVTDINGSALSVPLTSPFTTASSSASSSGMLVLSWDATMNALSSTTEATVGATVSFSTYRVVAGDTLNYTPQQQLGWSTEDAKVAVVSSTGTVTAVAPGQTRISACANQLCAHADVLVLAVQTAGIPAIDIGDLGGGGYSEIESMAGEFATGIATFQSGTERRSHAFLWSASRGMEDLGAPIGQTWSIGQMVATNGDVIGYDYSFHWWVWTRATGMQALPMPDLVNGWLPMAVNGRGEVAYSSMDGSLIGFWSPTTGARAASAPGGSVFVQGMNDAAQMVAFASPAKYYWLNDTTAYIWDAHAGRYTDTLTTSGVLAGNAWDIWPSAINNRGVVAGYIFRSPELKLFRWSRQAGFTFLVVPNGGSTLHGPALDEAGDVTFIEGVTRNLGTGTTTEVGAGVWMANGDVVVLQSLGGPHTEVTGLNELSQAGGFSHVGSTSGDRHAVIWNLTAASPARVAASSKNPEASRKTVPAHAAATPKPTLSPPTSGRPP